MNRASENQEDILFQNSRGAQNRLTMPCCHTILLSDLCACVHVKDKMAS